MIVKLIGTIVQILDKKSGVSKKGNNWVSQDFLLEETNPNIQNPARVSFTVFGDDAINFYNFQLGQNVSVDCVLSSMPYGDKYFTSLRALAPNITAQAQPYRPQPQAQPQYQPQQQTYQQQPTQPQQPQQPQYQRQEVGADDLPF